jgi:glycosyltransferase involved in cell wall biosynthesis
VTGQIIELLRRDPEADVLVVTNMWPDPERPAYGVHVERQVKSLVDAGVSCDVAYVRGYRSPIVYPLAAAYFLWTSLSWRGRYRLVHVYAGETALSARFHVGAPMVVSYCGDDLLGDRGEDGSFARPARARAALLREHARLFPATITKTREMEDVLPAKVQGRNTVIPNGIRLDLFRPLERDEARTQLGWGEEPVALFAVAKPWSAAKRRGLAEEASRQAGFRLHVASDVAPDEMPVLMSAADCLLLPSAVEGSPNVVKEALACNLPVVATAVGDVPERLAGVEPSWLCEPDVHSFTEALRECKMLGRRSNGREAAVALDEPRVAERILEVYRRVGGISTASSFAPLAAETD